MTQLVLILDNVRSSHNVGALLRTADSLGTFRVYAAGITPYPKLPRDSRDPVVISRNTREIAKTALGAERHVHVEHYVDTIAAIGQARRDGCAIYGLEQAPGSVPLDRAEPHFPAALVVGNEVAGLSPEVLAACDAVVEIPQRGHKESLNVAVAAGIALYALIYR